MIDWFDYNTRVVLLGTGLLGASAGGIGTFAVLRRRALTGDALGHAALPGLCLAFLIAGHRSMPALLLGAFISGLIGISIITFLKHGTRIKEDAAIALVLSVFFGLGTVLLRTIQNQQRSGQAGLESFLLGKTAGMIWQDLQVIAGLSLATLLLVVMLFKEFQMVSFDADFAQVQGWPARALDYLLLLLVAVAVVVGLPVVGVLLMAALLILPAASARFWTQRLQTMLILSASLGALAGIAGTLVSSQVARLPAGPCIVLFATGFFLVSLLLGTQGGVLFRWLASPARRGLEPPPPLPEEIP